MHRLSGRLRQTCAMPFLTGLGGLDRRRGRRCAVALATAVALVVAGCSAAPVQSATTVTTDPPPAVTSGPGTASAGSPTVSGSVPPASAVVTATPTSAADATAAAATPAAVSAAGSSGTPVESSECPGVRCVSIVVTGDPGAGKTATLYELAALLEDRDVVVLASDSLEAASLGLLRGSAWRWRVLRASALCELAIGLIAIAALALGVSYLGGIHNEVGRNAWVASIAGSVLLFPYLIVYPGLQLLWLSARAREGVAHRKLESA